MKTIKLIYAAPAVLPLCFTAASWAAPALDEVIVTAQRRDETLKSVPMTVKVMNAEELQTLNVKQASDVTGQTPGVVFDTGSASLPKLSIRGFSSPSSDGVESSVVTLIDGAYIPRMRALGASLYDMSSVEVLKGAQGALYGRNAIAGILRLVTAEPTPDFSANIATEFGNDDYRRWEGMVSGPLTDTLLGRLSFISSERDGYLDNDQGVDGGGLKTEGYRGRLKWVPTDALAVDLKVDHLRHIDRGARPQLDKILDPALLSTTRFTALTPRQLDTKVDLKQSVGPGPIGRGGLIDFGYVGNPIEMDTALVKLNYDFDSGYALASMTSYNFNHGQRKMDVSGTPVAGIPIAANQNFRTLSQELQLSSPDSGRFSYVAGVYFENTKFRSYGRSVIDYDATGGFTGGIASGLAAMFPDGLDAIGVAERSLIHDGRFAPDVLARDDRSTREETTSQSIYFEGHYLFTDEWEAIFGVRYTHDRQKVRKTFAATNSSGAPLASTAWLGDYMAGIAGDPTVAAYAAGNPFFLPTVRAFVEGTYTGYLVPLLEDGVFRDSRSESSVTPSLRIKYTPDEDTMLYLALSTGYKGGGFNVDAVSMSDVTDFENETADSIEIGGKFDFFQSSMRLDAALFWTEFDDLQVSRITPDNTYAFQNAATARSRGLDLLLNWQLTENLLTQIGYAYVDAEYTKFKDAPCSVFANYTGCTQDLSGEPLLYAPKNSGLVNFIYDSPFFSTGWDLKASVSFTYRDKSYVDITHDYQTDDIFSMGARLALNHPASGWEIALAGTNLTDERNVVFRGPEAIFGYALQTAQIDPPRMYWLRVAKQF